MLSSLECYRDCYTTLFPSESWHKRRVSKLKGWVNRTTTSWSLWNLKRSKSATSKHNALAPTLFLLLSNTKPTTTSKLARDTVCNVIDHCLFILFHSRLKGDKEKRGPESRNSNNRQKNVRTTTTTTTTWSVSRLGLSTSSWWSGRHYLTVSGSKPISSISLF